MTKQTLGLYALSATAIALAVIMLGRNQDDPEPDVVVAQPNATLPAPAPVTAPAVAPAPPLSQVVTPRPVEQVVKRVTPQSVAYYEATNLKSVVDNASANPAAGSYYYATLALRECESILMGTITARGEAPNLGGPKREAMMNKAKDRCRDVPTDPKKLRTLGDEGLAAGDAAFALMPPVSSKPRNFTMAGLLNALYTSPDAGWTQLVLNDLVLASDRLRVGARQQMSEIERSSLPAAIMLLGCDMGIPCDDRHPLVQFNCIARGRCEDSLQALLQRYDDQWAAYTSGTRFDMQTAIALKQEIAAGIARGDRQALRKAGG